MKKIITAITLLFGVYFNAQEHQQLIKKGKSLVFGTNLSVGISVEPKDNFGISLGLEFKNETLLGFGVFLNTITYDALNYKKKPPLNQIENYNPETDQQFDGFLYIDGGTKDNLSIITFHISNGYRINKRIITDLQIGPSVNIFYRNIYSYRYSPPFGSFSGSSPGSFIAKAKEDKLLIIGFNIKASFFYSIDTNTVLSVSPYLNVNREVRVFGCHIGFVFGKKYKRNLFNN